ncbi:MAG: YARHG domain-containing protein [Brotaphodocola sp.]
MIKRKKYRIILYSAVLSILLTGCTPSRIKEAASALNDVRNHAQKYGTGQAEELIGKLTEKFGQSEAETDPSIPETRQSVKETPEILGDSDELDESQDIYERFILDNLEKTLGECTDLSFQYGYKRQDNTYNPDYWYADAQTAPLSDNLICADRFDLDQDGLDEFLVFRMEGSQENGSGHNSLFLDVYGMSNQEWMKKGSIQFSECFEHYNEEEYLIGLKTVGQNVWIYVYDNQSVWSWADGENPQIRLYQYDGTYLKEHYQVSCSGSDGSWWEEWEQELHAYGFKIPVSFSRNPRLIGETDFEVLLYGISTTIVNKNEMYRNLSSEQDSQQYMLDHAVMYGNVSGQKNQIAHLLDEKQKSLSDNTVVWESSSDDQIIPDSSQRYLTKAELFRFTSEELRLARNEIYARHGRKFQSEDLQAYFNSKSWYHATIEANQFSEDNLNSYEKENVKLIKSMEE